MNAVPSTIEETFNQDFFQDKFEIVAGKDGSHKSIHSVSVMEVADFVNFDLGDNLFVLTTFSFCKTGSCDMVDTFQALAEQNIAGLLVKLNRYYQELPPAIYDIANQYKIPVITTHNDIPFRDIITEISKNIINTQMETIVMMNDMYKNLYHSLISNHTIEKYIDLLNIPDDLYYYVKLEGNIVYESNSNNEFEIDKINHIKIDAQEASKSYDSYYTVKKEDRELIVFPIGGINNFSSRIVIDKTKREIPHILIMTFTQLASYLSIKFTEYRLSQEEKINNNSRIYSTLIESPHTNHDKALNLLHLGGYANYPAFQLIYVHIDIASNSAFEVIKNKYSAVFNEENEQRFISLHSNGFSLIYGKRSTFQKEDEAFDRFIKRLNDILNQEESSFKIGISQIFNDYAKVWLAHDQAKRTTLISTKIKEFREVNYYDDIWEVDMLRALNNSNQVTSLEDNVIQPLIDYDQTHQLGLIETLGESIQTESLKDIANNLFIHTTTLRYRYERIEKITGYNFLTNKGRFVLTCAYFVYMLNH